VFVKLADKICNLRDLVNSPPAWSLQRQREYFDRAKAVVDRLPRVNAQVLEHFAETYRAWP
jgi:guanosine-3',5'-bis(diphosphate) 3'-pyrophosphohydrolase